MKRWLPWLVVPVLIAISVVFGHARSDALLADTDTKVLLEKIRETQDPMAWFTGDWPLENHFYRPISTLTFEFDNAVHGTNAAGYGLTNAILGALCILLFFWFLRELTDVPWMAGLATTLFGLWHLERSLIGWIPLVFGAGAVLVWLGLLRGRKNFWPVLCASLALVFLATQFGPMQEIYRIMLAWLPGRTASVMMVFVLISLAAYCRYERLTGKPLPPSEPTPQDLPATKSTAAPATPGRLPWVWLVVSVLGLALALGSYEQAVMLPASLLGVAIIMRLHHRRRPHWTFHAVNWLVLFGYLALRSAVLPDTASGYQEQQFRTGPGVWLSLGDYALPGLVNLPQFWIVASTGIVMALDATFWMPLIRTGGWLTAWGAAWQDRRRWLTLGMLLLSFVAFLPMAWLHQFGHYHYWPNAMRALYLILLTIGVGQLVATAIAPRGIQAPPRRDPAPGSLPRR